MNLLPAVCVYVTPFVPIQMQFSSIQLSMQLKWRALKAIDALTQMV